MGFLNNTKRDSSIFICMIQYNVTSVSASPCSFRGFRRQGHPHNFLFQPLYSVQSAWFSSKPSGNL